MPIPAKPLPPSAQSYAEFAQELAALKVRQQVFARLGVTGRTALLQAFAERLAQNKERLAEMVCEEVGRCLHECRAELDKSVELIRYYVRLAPELLAHKTIATQASLSQVRFEPLGVVLAVMPWNYPVWQVLRFAIPALCAGKRLCRQTCAQCCSGHALRCWNWFQTTLPVRIGALVE